ncbi:MAG: site-specific integrase [Clostridiales Family XIII bacterium]|jgi:integrase|nr:site-specific integrase [Clostridiales Family XIII bacterium]
MRKANGEGSLRQRKDGTWEYRAVVGRGLDGKVVRKSFYSKTKTGGKAAYKEYLKTSPVAIEKIMTVGEWAVKWLEVYKKGKIAHSSYQTYKGYISHYISPAIGYIKLDNVRPVHLEQLIGSLSGRSWAMRRDMVTILRGMFGSASENYYCSADPSRNISPGKKTQREIKVFRREQLAKILDFADGHRYGHYIELLLYTGLRSGELLALKWPDIDGDIITVRSAVALEEDGYREKGTKTDRIRHIAVSHELQEILKRIPKSGLYVLSERGNRLCYDTFLHRYKRFFVDLNATLKKNEIIAYLSPHKCRHTFGTYLPAGGANIRATQTLLGHVQVTTTQQYTHVDAEDLKLTIAKLEYKTTTSETAKVKS